MRLFFHFSCAVKQEKFQFFLFVLLGSIAIIIALRRFAFFDSVCHFFPSHKKKLWVFFKKKDREEKNQMPPESSSSSQKTGIMRYTSLNRRQGYIWVFSDPYLVREFVVVNG